MLFAPLQEQVGQFWHDGKLGVAQEHDCSNLIKQKIFSAMNQMRRVEEGSHIVVACPTQEWHEISALTAGYLRARRGGRVHDEMGGAIAVYWLFPSLLPVGSPAAEPKEGTKSRQERGASRHCDAR